MTAFQTWKEDPEKVFGMPFRNASISAEVAPELLGVGYIIGPRIASVMCAGGVLAYLVLIPMISYFGQFLSVPLAPRALHSSRTCRHLRFATRTSSTSVPAQSRPAADQCLPFASDHLAWAAWRR
jgi:hypothetical protein